MANIGGKVISGQEDPIFEKLVQLRKDLLFLNQKYIEGVFKVPIHLAFGHEALAVALFEAMAPQDKLVLTHRNCTHNILREGLETVYQEYLMSPEGLAHGKLGSMNLSTPNKGVMYSSSILGNNLCVAPGIALAQKIKKQDSVTVVLTGDGACEEGAFYESLVFSAAKKLSCLYVIENNGWSMSTAILDRRPEINFELYAKSMGLPFVKLTSNNVWEYSDLLSSLRQRSLSESTPIVIEAVLATLGAYNDPATGRYINYHAGPARKLSAEVVLQKSSEDPIYVAMNARGLI